MPQPIDLVAIDGGGTGTRLRAIAADGTIVAESASGPSSLTLGVEQAWRNISDGLRAISRTTGAEPRRPRLYCGLAGGRSPERQAQFRASDPVGCAEIVIVTDGFASLVGAHGGRAGVVLAIGTGVAAYALGQDGQVRSASAWGFAIGDEGSGAWIGRQAVSLLSRSLDGRLQAPSAMLDRIADLVGGSFNQIQTWLSTASATQFATLAPAVIEAAEAGDPLALDLMARATAELEIAVAAVDDGGPIALLGGLAPIFRPRFSAALTARIAPARGNALDGLATMARFGWRDEALPPAEDRPHG